MPLSPVHIDKIYEVIYQIEEQIKNPEYELSGVAEEELIEEVQELKAQLPKMNMGKFRNRFAALMAKIQKIAPLLKKELWPEVKK